MDIVIQKHIQVPMRDGVTLATDVYRPAVGGPFPTLVMRRPYNKELIGLITAVGPDILRVVQANYAVVVQDCRGRFGSAGTFTPYVDETHDGADTIAWAARQTWSNGAVGTIGASYVGATQWLAAVDAPPALRAMAPNITTDQYYDHWTYQGGAFQLGFILSWSLGFAAGEMQRRVAAGQATTTEAGALTQALDDIFTLYRKLPLVDMPQLKEAAPYYFEWLDHPTYDAYWRAIAPKEHYASITAPALNIGGWFDIFLGGTLANYCGMRAYGGSDDARAYQRLIIGPWAHGMASGIFFARNFGVRASADAADLTGAQLRWFDYWLKGESNGLRDDKPVKLFVMGIDQWREEDDWPLPDTQYRNYYLHSNGHANSLGGDGVLSTAPYADSLPPDVYCYDPRDPVFTAGGATLLPGAQSGVNVGPYDQRAVEARADVLVYTTPPLERAVEVTGPIALVLYVSSSASDTDFVGKLVDVYPDGQALMLTDGILRARYRNGFARPELLKPDAVYELHIDLVATANVFKAGHCIRLEVSSSNFPRFDRNTNTGGNIATQTEADFVVATNRVFHEPARPSHLILPIIERG